MGPPGRDDRSDGAADERPPWATHAAGNEPSSDDVKVAGTPIAPYAGPSAGADSTWPGAPFDDAAQQTPGEPAVASTGALEPVYDAADGAFAPRHEQTETGRAPVSPAAGGTPREPGDEGVPPGRRGPNAPRKLVKLGVIAAAAVVVLGGGAAGAMALTSGSGTADKAAAPAPSAPASSRAVAPLTDAQRKDAENRRRQDLKERAAHAARQDRSRPRLLVKGEPPPSPSPSDAPPSGGAGDPVPAGEAQKIARGMLPSYGWSPSSQFGCLVSLWNRESGWNTHAANPSGAYGIPQALPGSKMASAGADWQNNAHTQIKWGLGYIKGRYSTPCGAWGHSQSTGWY